MTLADALTIGGILVAIMIGLVRHAQVDARYRQRLRSLEHRVKKFDGIDANGG